MKIKKKMKVMNVKMIKTLAPTVSFLPFMVINVHRFLSKSTKILQEAISNTKW